MPDSATIALRRESETWRERFNKLFASLAVRHGIKCGLAGVLSVFVALRLRLPEPTWALITVFVIMFAQFVGAVAEKAGMRVIGTAIGGVIGFPEPLLLPLRDTKVTCLESPLLKYLQVDCNKCPRNSNCKLLAVCDGLRHLYTHGFPKECPA
jgi:hypothetical protein